MLRKTVTGNKKIKPAQKATVEAKKTKTIKEVIFPIVAIGASSGGLEAVRELFKYLPADTGMAYIFIQHLSPDHKSLLASLLAKSTKMKVQEIDGTERMQPNNVYVIPYNKGIEVTDGHIKLIPRSKSASALSIDVLFTSLAATHKENAIGIILSGNASDGTQGLKAIKAEGGITFAQDNSAKYNSMPESAISEGVADFVLSPKEIAMELSRISKHVRARPRISDTNSEQAIADNDPVLKNILQLLQEEIGVDFSHYKMNTVKRRIARRMFFYKLNTAKEYFKILKANKQEIEVLYNDLLINFTDFFRDTEAFGYFKTTLFPKLLKEKAQNETLRIWVTACSTGQEAYSIAMLLIEILGNKFPGKQVQIFATDLSEKAIKKARAGIYTKSEVSGISPKRLERFFTEADGNYRITKPVRDLCSFAPHNILSNPPFSRMDFISCCNLLIYLDTDMHKKVLKTFHYALNNGGSLMLGKSETTGTSSLFTQTDRKFKLYTRKEGTRSLPDLSPAGYRPVPAKTEAQPNKKAPDNDPLNTEATINNLIFSRYMPAYVVINHAMTIVQFKGATSKYLEHSTGKATLNILNMVRPEIAFALMESIHKAIETGLEVHKEDIEIKNDTGLFTVALDVIPIDTDTTAPLLLVIFTEQKHTDQTAHAIAKNGTTDKNGTIKKLKEEIAVIRAELVSVNEEKEKENKKLQATQEEILSSNEEFQCMNEELETSKEEIESANEELITTNQELSTRNEELAEAYDYSEAIITTLHEPMLILDKDMRVKSANKAFYKKFLMPQVGTEGVLLYELGDNEWDIPRLRQLLENISQKENHLYDYEITQEFSRIGTKTMLLNARRIEQKVKQEQLVLLAFTDITEKSLERKAEKKGLENIISERTAELKESYREMKEQNLSLERINKELETFNFISSHDLQEPLRKINNFTTLLLKEENKHLSATGKDYLQRMKATGLRMQRLIEDLLAYSRVKSTIHLFEKTDLNELINSVADDFEEILKEKKGTIKITGDCPANVIRFQFRQLLSNLISNAIKFASDSRSLRITIKCSTATGSDLKNDQLLPDATYAHICVSDNGIGFEPQYIDRIFEVFQRLHEQSEYGGTGIGLAICKRIVENHYGIITAKGVPDKGAQFDIYIPTSF